MARTISAALLTAQQGVSGTPYVKLKFTSKDGGTTYDYSSRLLELEHHEDPYNDYAVIRLRDDDLTVVDLTGYWVQIGYGFYTGNNVAEPNGDNAGNEYSYSSRLWVKWQSPSSAEGILRQTLRLEGMWSVLGEYVLLLGDPPFYNEEYTTTTVYGIITAFLADVSTGTGYTFTLDALGTQDDGIINTFLPDFTINQVAYEDVRSLINTLMEMTKCYLRAQAGLAFKVIYPRTDDANNEEYYSYQAHFFYEYTEKVNLLIPNRVIVFAYFGEGIPLSDLITATVNDTTQQARYMLVTGLYQAALITNLTDALNRADAILTRLKAEMLSGRLIIPHDSRVELYDKVRVYDTRGL